MKAARCAERDPARAGQPVAVDDEDLVRDRLQPVEPLEEVLVVEPADAGAVALHQPGPVQAKVPVQTPTSGTPAAAARSRKRTVSGCRFSISSTSPPTTTR